MGNQTHRVNRQANLGNEAQNRPVPNNQMKCPKCQIVMPPGTTLLNVLNKRICSFLIIPEHVFKHIRTIKIFQAI